VEGTDTLERGRAAYAARGWSAATGALPARAACDELERIAAQRATDMLSAMVASTRGAVELAGGDPRNALPFLRQGFARWHDLDAPYETARAAARRGGLPRARRRGLGGTRARSGGAVVTRAARRPRPSGLTPRRSGPRASNP
jgi:hypothetical protein